MSETELSTLDWDPSSGPRRHMGDTPKEILRIGDVRHGRSPSFTPTCSSFCHPTLLVDGVSFRPYYSRGRPQRSDVPTEETVLPVVERGTPRTLRLLLNPGNRGSISTLMGFNPRQKKFLVRSQTSRWDTCHCGQCPKPKPASDQGTPEPNQ